ncbi:hypothetical protein DSM107010_66000 [Chroococcidiopsis cubana SAG 39.79]|uniref:Uncharacterized protein n=1 Tax=Chroococcidiopsis cubana SAG 39.79 TaxID=388085 RepID=A0AB37U9Y3_9CYAN|nr:hypothetical protein [Chroococcidiopsis cubana]RUT01157.1 hypothetical protein DSM107010_66000 [Chroococcidiopsis cubana SAG 39.79]
MEEITRFFGSLFRSIFYRIKYRVTDAIEQLFKTNIDRQFGRRQKSKEQEQAEDDRK